MSTTWGPAVASRRWLAGRWTDRRWLVDAAIAVCVTAAQLAALRWTPSWHDQHTAAGPGWPAYLLLGAGGLGLLGRRRFPTAVLAVAVGAALAPGIPADTGMVWIVPIAALFNAVWAGKHVAAAASLVIGYLASFWPEWRIGRPGNASVAFAVGVGAWMLVLLAVAELIRIRRQRAAAVTLSRQEHARRQASEERMRMAREIHDVLAHNISVINVQANTALHLMDRQPERAREALTTIHDVSRQALSELRSVVGMLRADSDGVPMAPSPGLAQLGGLVAAVRKAGLDVRLTVAGDQRELPTDADLAAYRIVQEALTNTSRHSASQVATVLVSFQRGGVLVEVDDHGPARSSGPSSGNGITGMTERAQALGGTLSAGPAPDGGFRVRAWLPAPDQAVRATRQPEPLEREPEPQEREPQPREPAPREPEPREREPEPHRSAR